MERNIYPDKEALAESFCSAFILFLEASFAQKQVVHVALSGGSTPLAVFRELAARTVPELWQYVHLYWGDERCVEADDPESNYGQAKKYLLDPLDIKSERVHRIRGEKDPDSETEAYAELIARLVPAKGHWPVFDWIWLGMGSDGHTASIFPDQLKLWNAEAVCVKARHPESAQIRVSLSGNVINAAKRVSLLITGKEKAPVIRALFHKEGAYLSYPVTYVKAERLEYFLDQDAAGQL